MLPFTKMQGAGNHFVLLEEGAGAEEGGRDWGALAPELCRPRKGAGADGLLLLSGSAGADVRMRMFNPDGTEDHCGNGLRCLAWYARRRGLVEADEFTVETLAGVKRVRIEARDGRLAQVTAEMGEAVLDPARIPALFPGPDALGVPVEVAGETLEVHSLSTGTAHTVIFEIPDDARFLRLSPLLEHHPLFPERTSVMWTEVAGPDRLRLRIWERGAGETLACGTGACAAAAAAHLSGRAGPRVEVRSAGGALVVEIGAGLALRLTGPAAFVYDGVWRSG